MKVQLAPEGDPALDNVSLFIAKLFKMSKGSTKSDGETKGNICSFN